MLFLHLTVEQIAEGLTHGTTSPPSRHNICRWMLVAFQNLPEQMIRNSWKHGEYPPPNEFLFLAMNESNEE